MLNRHGTEQCKHGTEQQPFRYLPHNPASWTTRLARLFPKTLTRDCLLPMRISAPRFILWPFSFECSRTSDSESLGGGRAVQRAQCSRVRPRLDTGINLLNDFAKHSHVTVAKP